MFICLGSVIVPLKNLIKSLPDISLLISSIVTIITEVLLLLGMVSLHVLLKSLFLEECSCALIARENTLGGVLLTQDTHVLS